MENLLREDTVEQKLARALRANTILLLELARLQELLAGKLTAPQPILGPDLPGDSEGIWFEFTDGP